MMLFGYFYNAYRKILADELSNKIVMGKHANFKQITFFNVLSRSSLVLPKQLTFEIHQHT